MAHETARALLEHGRDRAQPETVSRLVRLVESEGIETVAELWSQSPAISLPGAFWRLYVVREWVRRDPRHIVLHYTQGLAVAEVAGVIAGVGDAPGPQDVSRTVDLILAGVFDGELDVALDRAAAFLKVLAAGTAIGADSMEPTDAELAELVVRRASALLGTAEELEQAAVLARRGALG